MFVLFFAMDIVGYGLSLLLLLLFFLISEIELIPPESFLCSSEDGKWFAPICEGATFASRFTTNSVSRTWNLFLFGERKSNRGVRMCLRSRQQKIQLIFNREKCDVTLPWYQNFRITTIGSFCNVDGEQQRNNTFRLAKKHLCTCITLFRTFLSRCCTTATWNFLI